jgi:hypothetical protein
VRQEAVMARTIGLWIARGAALVSSGTILVCLIIYAQRGPQEAPRAVAPPLRAVAPRPSPPPVAEPTAIAAPAAGRRSIEEVFEAEGRVAHGANQGRFFPATKADPFLAKVLAEQAAKESGVLGVISALPDLGAAALPSAATQGGAPR